MTLRQQLGFTDDLVVYPELARLANPADVFEHSRAWRLDGALLSPHDLSDRKPVTPPWPTEPNGNPAKEHDAWFRWFATTPDAVAWAPSPKQLEAEQARLRDYVLDLVPFLSLVTHRTEPAPPPEYVERPPLRQATAPRVRRIG